MIKIGILGAIGSGKSYVANNFGYPVFCADKEVSKLYRKDKKIFNKLKKKLPKFFNTFPVKKEEVLNSILANEKNLKEIVKIIHKEIRKKMKSFLLKNKYKKIVILDIPLLLENKLNKSNDILIFINSKQSDIKDKLKKRKNFNKKLLYKFKKIQLPLDYKRKKSNYIINNNFTKKSVTREIKKILKKILYIQ